VPVRARVPLLGRREDGTGWRAHSAGGRCVLLSVGGRWWRGGTPFFVGFRVSVCLFLALFVHLLGPVPLFAASLRSVSLALPIPHVEEFKHTLRFHYGTREEDRGLRQMGNRSAENR
jgi:hypothetical protein